MDKIIQLGPEWNLPRPGDKDWEAENPGPSSYKCAVCGKAIHEFHNERYDAYYCPECNMSLPVLIQSVVSTQQGRRNRYD
jgi:DNA-directed RNA polymerase subunit RPC12/RpoP